MEQPRLYSGKVICTSATFFIVLDLEYCFFFRSVGLTNEITPVCNSRLIRDELVLIVHFLGAIRMGVLNIGRNLCNHVWIGHTLKIAIDSTKLKFFVFVLAVQKKRR